MIPLSGAEYAYIKLAFGSAPAFLFAWVVIIVLRPASMAIMSLTSAEYIISPIFEGFCNVAPTVFLKKTLASLMVCK